MESRLACVHGGIGLASPRGALIVILRAADAPRELAGAGAFRVLSRWERVIAGPQDGAASPRARSPRGYEARRGQGSGSCYVTVRLHLCCEARAATDLHCTASGFRTHQRVSAASLIFAASRFTLAMWACNARCGSFPVVMCGRRGGVRGRWGAWTGAPPTASVARPD